MNKKNRILLSALIFCLLFTTSCSKVFGTAGKVGLVIGYFILSMFIMCIVGSVFDLDGTSDKVMVPAWIISIIAFAVALFNNVSILYSLLIGLGTLFVIFGILFLINKGMGTEDNNTQSKNVSTPRTNVAPQRQNATPQSPPRQLTTNEKIANFCDLIVKIIDYEDRKKSKR